ncbi:MAG: hypothetical protein NUW01_02605, partial [Gemmatimonadaceae bacterium]|nr:hypothetical protein [Gemmatimonadaceae bacterium]
TEPVEIIGSMSFTYSGSESGSFSVSEPAGPRTTGVTGVKFDGPPNLLFVAGISMQSSTHGDILELILSNVMAPRTLSLDDDCDSTTGDCPLGFFSRNVDASLIGDPGDLPFIFTSGSVTVTLITSERIAGTFQGTAKTLVLEGTPRVVTITNGKFDVPLMSLDDLN